MIEILFKGKRKDNGEWIEGLLFHKYFAEIPHDRLVIQYQPKSDNCKFKPPYMAEEIIPETVGRYTGVTVGNEKLFECDVVEWHEDYDDTWGYAQTAVGRSVVVWDEENFCWAFETDGYLQSFNDWNWNSSFIIGNIHDNPELLKGGEAE